MRMIIAILLLLPCQIAFSQQRPNVILVFADDLGYGETGPYGQQKIKTPTLDKLAAEGIRFTQFYTGTPVCAPSRCNLMTGRHAGRAYIRGNYGLPGYKENEVENGSFPLPENTVTIASLFKQAGYATGAVGKWGLGNYDNSGDPLKNGFDYFYGYYDQRHAHNYYPTHLWENGRQDSLQNPVIDVHPGPGAPLSPELYKGADYAIDKMTAKASAFIRRHQHAPFFLYLPFTLPHAALQVPERGVKDYIAAFGETPQYTQDGYVPVEYPKSTYAAMVSYLDEQTGIIWKLVKELGLDDNTIIIFTSDNGTAAGKSTNASFFNSTGGLRGFKQDLYEGGIREPFIVRWPGKIKAGGVTGHIAATYDLMATFAALLGVEAPEHDGINLLPVLTGEKNAPQHPYLYWEYHARGGQVAVRMGNWKGVRTGLAKDPGAPWQVYDLSADPAETKDLAAQQPTLVRQFNAIVQQEHRPPVRAEWDFFNPQRAGIAR
ncbi:arylsulfatase [Chitinophaga sp.]|uniref:arylsulfatase n=1 Tax=Chitinophaga sp. TaxID=1869181 RepID=UPI0031DB7A4E